MRSSGLTWEEIDRAGGVIRALALCALEDHGRADSIPISLPRYAGRAEPTAGTHATPTTRYVFHRDGIT